MRGRFRKGERYRYREFKSVTEGPGYPDDQPFICLGGGVFEPEYEPFELGRTYTAQELEGRTWLPGRRREVPPETDVVYVVDRNGQGYFEEVLEPSAFSLVSASEVVDAVEELRRRGLDARDVARVAGISTESAERAIAGHGHIRRSTRDALERAANGRGAT